MMCGDLLDCSHPQKKAPKAILLPLKFVPATSCTPVLAPSIPPPPHEPLKAPRYLHAAIEGHMNASPMAAGNTAQFPHQLENRHSITEHTSICWEELRAAKDCLRMARDVHPNNGPSRPAEIWFSLAKHGLNLVLRQVVPCKHLQWSGKRLSLAKQTTKSDRHTT